MDLRMTLEVEVDDKYSMPRPPISWKPQTYSLGEVVRNFDLPQVVQCDVSDCPVSVYNVNFDITQPLLLCLNRNIRKICARNLIFDKQVKSLREVGEPVLIPEDYKGWFAVLKDRSRVPHFGSIASVASSRVCRFLVTTKLLGFYILSDKNGSMTYARRELLPGDVLRAGKVYVGSSKAGKDFALFKKKKKKEVEVKFLKCTDETDREILINLNQTGTFYPISYTNGSVTGCVMQLSDILKKLYFPLDVKLVYGRIPNAPCSFSGMLKLTASFEEDTVVASTLVNFKNILLELSTQSVLLFKVAYATRQMLESKAYQHALEMCQERAEVYVRDMKVSFDFVAETSPTFSDNDSAYSAGACSTDPPLPGPRINREKNTQKNGDKEEQDRYIDTSGSSSLPQSSIPFENGSDYEMIWLSSAKDVKKRHPSSKDENSDTTERRASFRLSLEGTYLSCPIFSTDERMKQVSVDDCRDSERNPEKKTGPSSPEAIKDVTPPPLPPRVPKHKTTNISNGEMKQDNQNIYEVLKRTQPVEKVLQFQCKRISSVASASSSGSERSESDKTSCESSTNYENSSTNTSLGDNCLELTSLDDLRDYDFPEPYLLHKPTESNYSPVAASPEDTTSSSDLVSLYDGGLYRPVSPGEYLDDLPLGASCSQIGGYCSQSGTSGHTGVCSAGESPKRNHTCALNPCVADAAVDGSQLKTASGLSTLSVTDVGDALRRLGLRDKVVDSFVNENIDGELLSLFDEATLQETFPSLRSIDVRKICLFIQSGYQPNV